MDCAAHRCDVPQNCGCLEGSCSEPGRRLPALLLLGASACPGVRKGGSSGFRRCRTRQRLPSGPFPRGLACAAPAAPSCGVSGAPSAPLAGRRLANDAHLRHGPPTVSHPVSTAPRPLPASLRLFSFSALRVASVRCCPYTLPISSPCHLEAWTRPRNPTARITSLGCTNGSASALLFSRLQVPCPSVLSY